MAHLEKIREVFRILGAKELPDDNPPREEYGTLKAAVEGRRFSISWGHYGAKDRYCITASYLYDNNGCYVPPRDVVSYAERENFKDADITVANTKTAEQIVKDITRRFIPRHKELWDKVAAYIEQRNTYETTKKTFAKAVATLFKGSTGSNSIWLPGRYSVKHIDSTTCTLEIRNLTIEELQKIKATLDHE